MTSKTEATRLTPPEIVVFEVLDQVDAHATSEVSQGDVARLVVEALRAAGHLPH